MQTSSVGNAVFIFPSTQEVLKKKLELQKQRQLLLEKQIKEQKVRDAHP